jgi:hypothetical protein
MILPVQEGMTALCTTVSLLHKKECNYTQRVQFHISRFSEDCAAGWSGVICESGQNVTSSAEVRYMCIREPKKVIG